jgi:DNA-binding NarL/FixJ family response regulator
VDHGANLPRECSQLLSELAETRRKLHSSIQQGLSARKKLTQSCFALHRTLMEIRGRHGTFADELQAYGLSRTQARQALRILTARELEVVQRIAQGLSTKEIAAGMGITFKTAVTHRTRVLRKLQMHESASLVRLAIRAGLVRP